jgi:hypothetical protein
VCWLAWNGVFSRVWRRDLARLTLTLGEFAKRTIISTGTFD